MSNDSGKSLSPSKIWPKKKKEYHDNIRKVFWRDPKYAEKCVKILEALKLTEPTDVNDLRERLAIILVTIEHLGKELNDMNLELPAYLNQIYNILRPHLGRINQPFRALEEDQLVDIYFDQIINMCDIYNILSNYISLSIVKFKAEILNKMISEVANEIVAMKSMNTNIPDIKGLKQLLSNSKNLALSILEYETQDWLSINPEMRVNIHYKLGAYMELLKNYIMNAERSMVGDLQRYLPKKVRSPRSTSIKSAKTRLRGSGGSSLSSLSRDLYYNQSGSRSSRGSSNLEEDFDLE